MKKIFSLEKYFEDCKKCDNNLEKMAMAMRWWEGLDRKEVIDNHIGEYIIDDDWCEIVDDEDDIKAYAIPSDEIITKENLKQAIKECLLEIIGG